MSKNISEPQKNDMTHFLSIKDVPLPEALCQKIESQVKGDLNPNHLLVISKVFIIQFFTGISTLFICSQFGVSFLSINGLSVLFLKLGHLACMGLCGALFVGSGALITMFVLRPEEIKIIWKHKTLYYLLLSLLFLSIFYFLGTQHKTQSMFLAWLVGSVGGSQLALRLVKNFRFPHWDPLKKAFI